MTRSLETDLKIIAAQARQRRDDYDAFGHYLDIMWDREGHSDAELDALVNAIAAEVIPQIDCTACANCCRSLAVGLTPADIPPLALALDQTPDLVIASYVDQTNREQQGEWGVIRCSPCPLLRHNHCSVYAHRPQACHDYPA